MIFYVSSNPSDLIGLRDIYGLRHIGLIDTTSLYSKWRVPDPTAPYPQDYIVDKQGKVRFWEKEFEPKECIEMIEQLLGE